MTWSARRLSAVLSLIAVAACEPPTTTGPTGVMSDYVTSISARGGSVMATLHPGALPTGSKGPKSSVADRVRRRQTQAPSAPPMAP